MRMVALGLLVALSTSTPAAAQDVLTPGARIRLTAGVPPIAHTGALVYLERDSLRLLTCRQCAPKSFALATLGSLHVSRGTYVDRRRATLGLLLGAMAGWMIGDFHGRRSDGGCNSETAFCGGARALEPLGGAVLGGLVGIVPAFAFPRERWVRVLIQ